MTVACSQIFGKRFLFRKKLNISTNEDKIKELKKFNISLETLSIPGEDISKSASIEDLTSVLFIGLKQMSH